MPVYYEHCMAEMCQCHRLALIQRFMAALSRGEGGQRPIDLRAHDPTRYVQDILAWTTHQAKMEADTLTQLLHLIDAQQQRLTLHTPHHLSLTATPSAASHAIAPLGMGGGAAAVPAGGAASTSAVAAASPSPSSSSSASGVPPLLSAVFEGLSRVLRTRVEQAVQSVSSAETAFRMWDVTQTHAAAISPLFPPSSTFTASILALVDSARSHLFDVLRAQGEKLQLHPPQPPLDLSPPAVLSEGLSQLTAILSIAASSASASASASPTAPPIELAPVLAAELDPLLSSISAAAASLPTDSQAVYAINCLDQAVRTLKKYEGARGRTEVLHIQLEQQLQTTRTHTHTQHTRQSAHLTHSAGAQSAERAEGADSDAVGPLLPSSSAGRGCGVVCSAFLLFAAVVCGVVSGASGGSAAAVIAA